MNDRKRCIYPTAKQKKKLLELMKKYPDLALGKLTPTFKCNDAQKLWISIANECNAIPGSRKTWRQWRKTWQDIKSKTKKRQENGFSRTLFDLTDVEQQAIGIQLETSTSQGQEHTEFVNSDTLELDSAPGSFIIEDESNVSYYQLESPVEEEKVGEVYTSMLENNFKEEKNDNNKHSDTCVFNCNLIAKHEKRKLEIKEDYIKFRKDYLKQKLQLMKEQTNALRVIAKELSNKQCSASE